MCCCFVWLLLCLFVVCLAVGLCFAFCTFLHSLFSLFAAVNAQNAQNYEQNAHMLVFPYTLHTHICVRTTNEQQTMPARSLNWRTGPETKVNRARRSFVNDWANERSEIRTQRRCYSTVNWAHIKGGNPFCGSAGWKWFLFRWKSLPFYFR